MKVGDLVRFVDEPWGIGLITSERNIGGFFAYFPQVDDWFAICGENFPNQKVEVISEGRENE